MRELYTYIFSSQYMDADSRKYITGLAGWYEECHPETQHLAPLSASEQ